MKSARLRFFAGSVGAVAVAIIACGGSSNNPPANPTVDSGTPDTNVPDTNVPDTNVPDTNVPDTAVTCVDASLTSLTLPDASLDDAGASVGSCLACTNSQCASDVATCQGDCACLNALACVYQNCIATLSQGEIALGECASQAGCINLSGGAAGIPSGLLPLAQCIATSCATPCGTPSTTPEGGTTPDSGGEDAPSDAPTDAHDQ